MLVGSPARRRNGVLWAITLTTLLLTAHVAIAQSVDADLVAFDLLPNNNSNSIGAIDVVLGEGNNQQTVQVLAGFVTTSASPLLVPGAGLCIGLVDEVDESSPKDWNTILQPWKGDVILVNSSASDESVTEHMAVISWTPDENVQVVNLTLRKGIGDGAKNISQLEVEQDNDGLFAWPVVNTWKETNLKAAADYSILLWTNTPPRQSISGYFALTNDSSTEIEAIDSPEPSDEELASRKTCLGFLASTGGYYNSSDDPSFEIDNIFVDAYTANKSSFDIKFLGTGRTDVSIGPDTKVPGLDLTEIDVDSVSQISLGQGIIGFSTLQATRESTDDNNIVALHLGTEDNLGSIVLGGYDRNLLDSSNSAVFRKFAGSFEVILSEIEVLGKDGDKLATPFAPSFPTAPNITLAHDANELRLPEDIIKAILENIGSPKYDEGLGGYVFDGPPNTDFSLRFTFSNSSTDVTVDVPGASLVVTESTEDNPLTPRVESGVTYLRLRPASSFDTAYLGRALLQHVVIIEGPPRINRFILSGLPSPFPNTRDLVGPTGSSNDLAIFRTSNVFPKSKDDNSPAVGPVVGAVVGGLFVLAAIAGTTYYCIRMKRQRRGRFSPTPYLNPDSMEKDPHLFSSAAPEYDHSIRTTQTIPIRYSPSLAKEAGLGIAYNSSHSHGYSQPIPTVYHPPNHNRVSEVSTVARDYDFPTYTHSYVTAESRNGTSNDLAASPPATAALGRVFSSKSAQQVRMGGFGHAQLGHSKTASLGRIMTPTSVDLGSESSRRSSTHRTLSTGLKTGPMSEKSDSEHQAEPSYIRARDENGELPLEYRFPAAPSGETIGNGKTKGRRKGALSTSATSNSRKSGVASEASSVFGLDSVHKDGEFVSEPGGEGFLESNSEDDSENRHEIRRNR